MPAKKKVFMPWRSKLSASHLHWTRNLENVCLRLEQKQLNDNCKERWILHNSILQVQCIYGLNFFICAKQLKIEEIFLIYYEKIISNKKTLIVPQRQSKTFCWTQSLLHLRLNHKVQVEKMEHVVNAVSPWRTSKGTVIK